MESRSAAWRDWGCASRLVPVRDAYLMATIICLGASTLAASSSTGPHSRHCAWQCCTQLGRLPLAVRLSHRSHHSVNWGMKS